MPGSVTGVAAPLNQNLIAKGLGPSPAPGEKLEQDLVTTVVALENLVSEGELADDEEYNEIVDDIKDECAKMGTILDFVIPRPSKDGTPVDGVGKVFVKYDNTDSAQQAKNKIGGRTFNDRSVVAKFYDVEKFDMKIFS